MKKILYPMLAMLMAAFTFASCEDVPMPYEEPSNGTDTPDTPDETIDPAGTGTLADPYNVAAAIKYIEDGGSETAEVYVKGIVVSVKEGSFDSSYGSLKYYISDDGTPTNEFLVYNGYKAANRTKFGSEDDLKAGDVVVICGSLVNYNGTKEFTTGNYLVSLNGEATSGGTDEPDPGTDEATGDGTVDNPYNSVAANKACEALADNAQTETDVYVKGKVVSIKEQYGTQYGNATFYISDDGTAENQFYVYRALYLNNEKYASGTLLEVGDEVVICGRLTKYVSSYGTTFETVQGKAYLYSLKGNGGNGDNNGEVTTNGLISNGDFETWSGSTPTGWNTNSAGNATLTQSTDAHGGSYSVSVGYNASQNKRLGYQEIKLKPGTYKFSFYAKATTADESQCRPGYVAVIDGKVDSSNYKYGDYQSLNNSTWTLVTNEFTLDETTTLSLVVMNPKTSTYATAQNILIDDASLTTTDGGLAE